MTHYQVRVPRAGTPTRSTAPPSTAAARLLHEAPAIPPPLGCAGLAHPRRASFCEYLPLGWPRGRRVGEHEQGTRTVQHHPDGCPGAVCVALMCAGGCWQVMCAGGCWQRFVREARSALFGRVVVICVGGCCVGACLHGGVCGRLGSPYGCVDSVLCG